MSNYVLKCLKQAKIYTVFLLDVNRNLLILSKIMTGELVKMTIVFYSI